MIARGGRHLSRAFVKFMRHPHLSTNTPYLTHGVRDGGLSPSCTAQLVFVSVMAGISEAVAAPDVRVHHRQIDRVCHLNDTVPFERLCALLLARGVNLACGVRDDGLSPSCTAQLVFASFMAGIHEAGAAPDVHHGHTGSVILTIQCLLTARVLLAGPRRPLACGLRAGALGPSCTAQLVFVSFVVAICEVGTAPGRPTASSSAAVAPTVSFERRRLSCWLVASIWHAD